jgi:hypothetical protein
VFAKNLVSCRVDLAERHGLEPARALQPQIEAADSGEEGEDAIHHTPSASSSSRGREE